MDAITQQLNNRANFFMDDVSNLFERIQLIIEDVTL